MIVIKVGGSAVTDKSSFKKPKLEVIDKIAKDIADIRPGRLILVHGAGSFGHPFVVKYRLKEVEDIYGVVQAHLSCKELNRIICEFLLKYGLKPYPIHPFLTFRIENGKINFDRFLIENALKKGFIPVLHGDMVYNMDLNRFVVLSGDDITLELARIFKAEKVGFATDVDGVYVDGVLAKVVTSKDLEKIGFSKGIDVTGGMRGKVEKILRSSVKARIFNVSKLRDFLTCKDVGTLIAEKL